jgi:hypothetical protein
MSSSEVMEKIAVQAMVIINPEQLSIKHYQVAALTCPLTHQN